MTLLDGNRALEEYVVPVVTYTNNNGLAHYRNLIGTAFFVGSKGVFLTARHVIEAAQSMVATEVGLLWGISGKIRTEKGLQDHIFPVVIWEYCKSPLDLAFGQTVVDVKSEFKLSQIDAAIWLDVAAVGYPISALNVQPQDYRIRLQGRKGYIQRILEPSDFPTGVHPLSFELSFTVDKGMSGAPLFRAGTDAFHVFGICVGSKQTEIVDYQYAEVSDDGKHFSEKRMLITTEGVAQSLLSISDYMPSFLFGREADLMS